MVRADIVKLHSLIANRVVPSRLLPASRALVTNPEEPGIFRKIQASENPCACRHRGSACPAIRRGTRQRFRDQGRQRRPTQPATGKPRPEKAQCHQGRQDPRHSSPGQELSVDGLVHACPVRSSARRCVRGCSNNRLSRASGEVERHPLCVRPTSTMQDPRLPIARPEADGRHRRYGHPRLVAFAPERKAGKGTAAVGCRSTSPCSCCWCDRASPWRNDLLMSCAARIPPMPPRMRRSRSRPAPRHPERSVHWPAFSRWQR